MSCSYDSTTIDNVIAFHGHSCPGLAIGIRAAEAALTALDRTEANDPATLLAVVETDMCGVDAIQFLTGCTMGKGNLLHKDHGKMAFTFHDRTAGRGVRLVLRPEVRADMDVRMGELMTKVAEGTATPEEKQEMAALRERLQQCFMTLPLDEMFTQEPTTQSPPRGPKVLASLACEACGEMTMESRTRRMQGQTLCIPCFAQVEQKV